MVNEDQLRVALEESGVDSEQAEQFILSVKKTEQGTGTPGIDYDQEMKLHELAIVQKMEATNDWREKARLAAKIISMGL